MDQSPRARRLQWHFVDIEIDGPDGGNLTTACAADPVPVGTPASDGPAKSCVTRKIKEFKQELGDAGTMSAERLLALKFLLHLVGDVHQPLHAADHMNPNGKPDRGGNCVGVLPGHNTRPVKLHAYWDTTVVVHALSGDPQEAAETVLAMITPATKTAWQSDDPDQWAGEFFWLPRTSPMTCRSHLSAPVSNSRLSSGARIPVARSRFSGCPLSTQPRAEQAARAQLAKAAVRLAFLLQQQLD